MAHYNRRRQRQTSKQYAMVTVKALIVTLAEKLAEEKAKTPLDILIKMPAETRRAAQTKTHCHPLLDVKIQAISVTLVELETSKMVDTWTDRVATVEIRTVDETLRQLETEALINTPSDALA